MASTALASVEQVEQTAKIKRNLRTESMNYIIIASAVTVFESYFGIRP